MPCVELKVNLNRLSNGELLDPLCDSVNRGLALVRLTYIVYIGAWIDVLCFK